MHCQIAPLVPKEGTTVLALTLPPMEGMQYHRAVRTRSRNSGGQTRNRSTSSASCHTGSGEKGIVMKIRYIIILFFLVELTLAVIGVTMTAQLSKTLLLVEQAQINRYQSYLLADELRQSSDDLTRFVRTYVTTGDKRYQQYFQNVIDIRNGILSRPDEYENVYWDLVVGGIISEPEDTGKSKISLEDRMLGAGFTMEEFSKLKEAQNRSDALINLEDVAMHALEGLFDDGSGSFKKRGQPNREMAIDLVHGTKYHTEKAGIMDPIGQFLRLVDLRTDAELKNLNTVSGNYLIIIFAVNVGLIITLLLLIWLLYLRFLKRSQLLLETAQQILNGNLNARSNIHGVDELGVLGSTFDTMVEKLSESMKDAEQKTVVANQRSEELKTEKSRSDQLLNNILPVSISERLKEGEDIIADQYPEVTVLFTDLVGFTELSAKLRPRQIVNVLNAIFETFDLLADEMKVEKIKTIGDSYMVVAGVPERDPLHCQRIADFALESVKQFQELANRFDYDLQMRIGFHTGTVVAGVVGKNKFSFDLWGDVVNTASRLESTSTPGAVHVSDAVKARLEDDYEFEDHGKTKLKGKGISQTWLLKERKLSSESTLLEEEK